MKAHGGAAKALKERHLGSVVDVRVMRLRLVRDDILASDGGVATAA